VSLARGSSPVVDHVSTAHPPQRPPLRSPVLPVDALDRPANRRVLPLGRLVAKAGRRWGGWVEAFPNAGWLRCGALGLWRQPDPEPWLLLTTWPGGKASGMAGGCGRNWRFGTSSRPASSGSAVIDVPLRQPIGCGWCWRWRGVFTDPCQPGEAGEGRSGAARAFADASPPDAEEKTARVRPDHIGHP
jgi:hypothetical protein